METFSNLWIEWILNGVMIAIVITFPALVGILFFSVLRREVKKDRQEFETKVIVLLEEIKNTQEKMMRENNPLS